MAATDKRVYRDLIHLAQCWEQGMRVLAGVKENEDTSITQVISPYARRRWRAQKEVTTDIPQVGGLKVATFGWWEIVLPTPKNTQGYNTAS